MKNFIWDFDGTLFDTYTHTVKILYQLMCEVGKNCDYDILFSKSRRSLIEARDYCGATNKEWEELVKNENRNITFFVASSDFAQNSGEFTA